MINVYCDESCHLLHDLAPIMTLGAITAPNDRVRAFAKSIRAAKHRFGCTGELKWTKVSEKNLPFYLALVDELFVEHDLAFRALVVQDKHRLDHERYNQGDHDSFYYKMYYYLLRNIVENRTSDELLVYLDIKDTRSGDKVRTLRDVLGRSLYDFEYALIKRVQQIRSHESELMQLCDFVLGAVTYANRGLDTSLAKLQVIRAIEQRLGHPLTKSTPPWEVKFNLFHFVPREE